jgi:hypothetical protein
MNIFTLVILNVILAANLITDRQENVTNIHDKTSSTNSGISLGGESYVKKPGKQISITKNLQPFSSIVVSGAFNLEIKSGQEYKTDISGDSADLKQLSLIIEKKNLLIKTNKDYNQNGEIVIILTVPNLTGINLSGAINCRAEITATDKFELVSSGAGDIILTGSCDKLIVTIDGAVNLDAVKLEAKNAIVTASGASTVAVNVSGKLAATASGASSINYKGKPEKLEKNISEVGSVKPLE